MSLMGPAHQYVSKFTQIVAKNQASYVACCFQAIIDSEIPVHLHSFQDGDSGGVTPLGTASQALDRCT